MLEPETGTAGAGSFVTTRGVLACGIESPEGVSEPGLETVTGQPDDRPGAEWTVRQTPLHWVESLPNG
ncbi:MAG: hypothetical protein KatS3mg104_1578 [Phycisphaerae bacterium]|nr:MAG: hypothetical protein KatS3mg104_1578 [Phycisphaerae bacterium]